MRRIPTDECILWRGKLSATGYGVDNSKRTPAQAHRNAWIKANGPIAVGLLVCHACDVRACVNLNHLFLGTAQDNTNDMMAKGRHRTNALKGAAHKMAELTAPEVREMRRTWREWGTYGRGGGIKGVSTDKVAAVWGISGPNLGYVVKRKTWVHT